MLTKYTSICISNRGKHHVGERDPTGFWIPLPRSILASPQSCINLSPTNRISQVARTSKGFWNCEHLF